MAENRAGDDGVAQELGQSRIGNGSGLISGSLNINTLLAFAFGVVFLSIMLGFAVWYPNPSPFQLDVFMVALSSSAAGVGAILPGFLDVQFKGVARAGGALGLFLLVWASQPAIAKAVVTLKVPGESPDATISKFLTDLDRADIDASYADLDQVSRDTMVPTKMFWQTLYDGNLKDLGQLEERKLLGVNAYESPPGFPMGIYRQQSFLSKYKAASGCRQEAVTVRADQDAHWKVYSYQISPVPVECGKVGGGSASTS